MNPEDLADLIASIITAAADPKDEGRLALLATIQRHRFKWPAGQLGPFRRAGMDRCG